MGRLPHRIGIFVAGVTLAAGGVACNSGDDPTIDIPATSTSETTATTAAGGADATTSTGAAAPPAGTPEEAAQGLFDAWEDDDRARAGRYATDRAVEQLFGSRGGPEGLEFQGCEPEGAQFSCAWRYEGGGLIMTVQGAPAGGFMVELTRFVAD